MQQIFIDTLPVIQSMLYKHINTCTNRCTHTHTHTPWTSTS